jgi:hypothetical protein
MIKHDHENESFQTISSKKQIWIAFLRSHLTFRDMTQNTLSTYSRSNSSQYSLQQANFHQKKLINLYSLQQWFVHRISSSRAKKQITASEKAYNRHVLEKKQFTNKTFIFIYLSLAFSKIRARFNLFVKSNDEIDSFYEIFVIFIKILSLHVKKISSSILIIISSSSYFHQLSRINSFENLLSNFQTIQIFLI